MSGENNDEMGAVLRMAEQVDADVIGVQEQEGERGADSEEQGQAGPDYAGEAIAITEIFAGLVVGFAPQAEKLWGEGTKRRIADTLAPVLEKYGVSMGGWGVELALVLTAGPVLWQSARIIAASVKKQAPVEVQQEAKAGATAA